MRKLVTLVLLILAVTGYVVMQNIKSDTPPEGAGKLAVERSTIPRITGIGGVFFKASDPAALKQWYQDNFGMKMNEYGSMFEFRLADAPDQKGYLQWSPFSEKTKYFQPSTKPYMINYRVVGIEALVDQLRAAGATIVDTIATYDYGKFVHVMDPDGNNIELWEPIDSTFTHEYEGETTY